METTLLKSNKAKLGGKLSDGQITQKVNALTFIQGSSLDEVPKIDRKKIFFLRLLEICLKG